MKRCINHLPVVLLIIGLIIVTGCTAPTEGERRQATLEVNREKLHLALEACTGTCLTREELAQLVYNYEKVQEKWSGAGFSDYEFKIPELQLVTPGEHKHDENTRYEITILGKDENGFETGLKVSVMEDTSACKMPEAPGDHWELVETYSETSDDVVKSDNSITYVGEGTEYVTQWENDFDSSYHAVMTFRCKMDELPTTLKPGDEIAINITADVISDGEPITNAYMSCNLTVPSSFNATSDTGANDSADGIYAGGNTLTGRAFVPYMTDCVRFKVPEKNENNDEIRIYFSTSSGETVWVYQWK
ncbi:MAG: hypothetical protein IJJ00_05840 [Erysipelotrichaceae bacterium]|nr:hypothetical protein [Erysipelotrichaceae bacterium]